MAAGEPGRGVGAARAPAGGVAGGATLASYTYLGAGQHVRVDYEQPQVMLDHWGGTAGTYDGLDRFGRVVDHCWFDYNGSVNVDRIRHGYDRSSNRLWRENMVGFNAIQDANFRVTVVTDDAGAVQERLRYTASGERTVLNQDFTEPNAPAAGSHAFAVGHQGLFHDETGLIHNRARALHPVLGRFRQRDPVGYACANLIGRFIRAVRRSLP